MQFLNPFLRSTQAAIIAGSGVLIVCLSLLVIIGWLSGSVALIQIDPTFSTMEFYTAIGFLVTGCGLLFLFGERRPQVALCGALAAGLGVATSLEYVFAVNIGIDEWLIAGYFTADDLSPGRMALTTCAAFVASGIALLLSATSRPKQSSRWRPEIPGALVAALGLSTLFGYLLQIEAIYDWTVWTRMSLHTGAGFLLLGTALVFAGWRVESSRAMIALPRIVFPIALGAAAVLLALWQGLVNQSDQNIGNAVVNRTTYLQGSLQRTLGAEIRALDRMAGRWDRQGGTPLDVWELDAKAYLRDLPDYRALALADPGLRLRATVTRNLDRALSDSLRPTADQRAEIDATIHTRAAVILPNTQFFDGEPGIVVVLPLHTGRSPDGFMLAVLDLSQLTQALFNELRGLGFAVYEGDTELFRGGREDPVGNPWLHETTFWIANKEWVLRAWPEEDALRSLNSSIPTVVLGSGLVVTLLLLLLIKLAHATQLRAANLTHLNNQLRETQAQLQALALYDELTGLGNRSLFTQQLESLVALTKRYQKRFGLLIMDLDGFKAINDTLGHDVGDMVLKEFAKRLTATLRESDHAFRLGGDEFAVLLAPDTSKDGSLAVAQKIDLAISRPIMLKGESRTIHVSIGAAVFPDHGDTVAELTRKADAAMYEAKTRGQAMAIASDLGATTVMKALREA